MSDQGLFVWKAKPPSGSTTGDDERLGMNRLFADAEREGTLTEIGLGDVSDAIFGAETRSLLAHILDEFRPLHALGKSRKIFNQRGEGELSARLVPFNDEGFEVRACAVKSSGMSGTSGADDDDVASIHKFVSIR